MLGALHGQRPGAVVEDQFRHAGEGAAVLPQHELALSGPCELQVQEALAAPGGQASQSALITPDLLRLSGPKAPLHTHTHGPQKLGPGIPKYFQKSASWVPSHGFGPHRQGRACRL